MNRHYSGLWHIYYLSIVLIPWWPFLRSRSSEVTTSNWRFWQFCVVTHVYGSFSSITRKMTLEHRLLHRNRNKMNIWNFMNTWKKIYGSGTAWYYVQMPWKAQMPISHIQNATKTFLKGITWNLLHTFFIDYSSTYIPFVLKVWKFWGFFSKIKYNVKKISKFPKFKNKKKSEIAVLQTFFSECINYFRLPLSLKMSVWQRFPLTLIFVQNRRNMTSLWRHFWPIYQK